MAFPLIPLLGTASTVLGGILDKLTGDDKRKVEILLEEMRLASAADMAQVEVNKVEAAHFSLFVAGWRPAFGWIGALACFFDWIVRPYLPLFWRSCPPLPPMPSDLMWVVVTGLLGLGGLRTFEKRKGVGK